MTERERFEAEWRRMGWGDESTKEQCFAFWQAASATPADPNAKMLSMRPTPEIISAMVQYGMTEKQAREAYAVVMCSVPSITPASYSVPVAMPKGWKLVPIKPTWEMIAKGSLLSLGRNMNEATVKSVWTGMLSVAKEPKESK